MQDCLDALAATGTTTHRQGKKMRSNCLACDQAPRTGQATDDSA